MAAPSGTPSSVFKHAIDLNRVSNSLQKPLAVAYNRILVKAARELQAMGTDEYSSSYRAKRLGQIIGSLKTSLDGWAKDSTKVLKTDLTDLAKIETEFAVAQMRQMIGDADDIVRELEVSPQFAEAVVSSDPTKLNLVTTEAGDTLTGKGVYKLTAKQGEALVLPNGDTVEKAFRGIATSSAQKFRLVVQDGLLTGVPTKQIVREIIGQHGGMKFASGQKVSARALALAGGEKGTRLANNQIMTLVRTSVNQVANKASQETYKANDSVTKKYRYIATIDSRTTLLCASKDDKLFDYNDGPIPPLHFNCRSTTVPVIDWDGLNKEYGIVAPDDIEGVGKSKRASVDGPVPAGTSYGDWLYDKRIKEGRKVLPGPEQIEALGYDKAVYFNRLAARYKDPRKAIVSLVREDGTEKTLAELRQAYNFKKVVRAQEPTIVIKNQKQLEKIAKAARAVQAKDLPSISQLQLQAAGSKVKPEDVAKVFALMDEMEGVAGTNARKLRRFAELKEVCCVWSTQREGTIIKNRSKMDHVLKNAQLKRSVERALKNEKQFSGNTSRVYQTVLDNAINLDEKASGPQSRLAFAYQEVKGYFTAQGKGRSRMNGFTFPGANHILIKRKADMRPITSLKQMREDVKDAIKRAKTGKDLYWSANGEGMYKGESHWLKTYVHEMGHQVHYASGKPTLSSYDWTPSQYGSSNSAERFAETFVQYIFAPVELKKASPSAYKWVEDTLSSSLKEVETWK